MPIYGKCNFSDLAPPDALLSFRVERALFQMCKDAKVFVAQRTHQPSCVYAWTASITALTVSGGVCGMMP